MLKKSPIINKNLQLKQQKEYEAALTAIETIHNLQNKKLDNKRKKEIKKIVKKHYNNKEALSSEISDLFGVKYVPKKNSNSN